MFCFYSGDAVTISAIDVGRINAALQPQITSTFEGERVGE